jgi:restriction system protein
MPLWLVRAGRHGEHMQRFLDTNRIYVTWHGLKTDLAKLQTRQDLQQLLRERYLDSSKGKIINNCGQLWPFVHEMRPGDWVVVPYKGKPAFNIAEITGPYIFDPTAEDPYYHYRTVKWIARDVPRSVFDQDLLYSLGAFMTICQITRNDAEQRVRAMAANGWKSAPAPTVDLSETKDAEAGEQVDLEQLARDQIARLIIQRFKGDGLSRLVEAVLQAQGYTTYRSPEGPDKGIDLLAAPGPLGFGRPRLCVQVKSGDSPVDLPTLNQLVGSMQNVQADQGLLVSWGGFKSSVDHEVPAQFFRVRLWDQDALIGELLTQYDRLDEDLRAELPLKRIWTLAVQGEDE